MSFCSSIRNLYRVLFPIHIALHCIASNAFICNIICITSIACDFDITSKRNGIPMQYVMRCTLLEHKLCKIFINKSIYSVRFVTTMSHNIVIMKKKSGTYETIANLRRSNTGKIKRRNEIRSREPSLKASRIAGKTLHIWNKFRQKFVLIENIQQMICIQFITTKSSKTEQNTALYMILTGE